MDTVKVITYEDAIAIFKGAVLFSDMITGAFWAYDYGYHKDESEEISLIDISAVDEDTMYMTKATHIFGISDDTMIVKNTYTEESKGLMPLDNVRPSDILNNH